MRNAMSREELKNELRGRLLEIHEDKQKQFSWHVKAELYD